MVPDFRAAYNAAFTPDRYEAYLAALEREVGRPPFRIAETPLFVPHGLRDFVDQSAREILQQLSDPRRIDAMRVAIPAEHDAPGMDALPACAQIDFAVVRGPGGALEGRVVELQGFPSLYAFTPVQLEAMCETLRAMPGLDRRWSTWFGGLDRDRAIDLFRRTVVAGEDPSAVVLVDIDPDAQKTKPDFVATRKLLGVESVCATRLVKDGRRLLRPSNGGLVPVRRIFNRIVFDELDRKGVRLPFSFRDDLDVVWCPHPNWYWVWSKYSLPFLDHAAVPRARLLSEAGDMLGRLDRCVLKPLFSFAGSGVRVDPTPDDVASIPEADRARWLVQDKVEYARDLVMPDGHGVAAEIRVMCLRPPDADRLVPAYVLVRLSRGKMLGVDQNRDLTWVGSAVGLWTDD